MASNYWGYKNIKKRNYLEAQAKKAELMIDLHCYNPKLTESSGIYIISRANKAKQDGSISKFVYVGQAKNVLDRLASHFLGFEQRIDVSLKTRALKTLSNPYGWNIEVVYCSEEELNEKERYWIHQYTNDPSYEVYNITSGGQDEGKEDINERKSAKKYNEGLKKGYENCLKDIKEYFSKYLDFAAKTSLVKKDGTPTAIVEKKYNEFVKLMKGED